MGLKPVAESTWKMAVNTMDFQSWDSVSKETIKAFLATKKFLYYNIYIRKKEVKILENYKN